MVEKNAIMDIDPQETQEWLDSLSLVIENDGSERAEFLLSKLIHKISFKNSTVNTPYCNTISKNAEVPYPGDLELEQKLRRITRWNAMAIVVNAQEIDPSLGGHIGTFASSAHLYDIGFNHFFRGNEGCTLGDLIYIQGHSSPGIYARAYLENIITKEQLLHFRQEVDGNGLSSYPHPWLMPNFWQFATVSMGLGPLQAIYQARFMRYLSARGLSDIADRRVWCFCGDGEMDEPESLGAISLAAREELDNLVFVVNCNLQRLDGPVRGNGKIIQELEAVFKGVGWNVIKVVWGSNWDPLLDEDESGKLLMRMAEVVDGEYQKYKAMGGAYVREHFFNHYEETKKIVDKLTDQEISELRRGGHDSIKLYNAYLAAVQHTGSPTVILAKTVKGFGLGSAGEALNIAHNTKKLTKEELLAFRDRFAIPLSDADAIEHKLYLPQEDSAEIRYLRAIRQTRKGFLPNRKVQYVSHIIPDEKIFAQFMEGTSGRIVSTTMILTRIIASLVKDLEIGKYIVPIVPDEARTFGMEVLFRQLGIYSSVGQKYEPVDSEQVMYYKESKDGQVLQEGITESGSFASWMAAAASYVNHGVMMIPFYVFYSMFGFQRIADLAWAAADMQCRGFLIGATSGKTTLNGEGLQHQDGFSHMFASNIPNCISYDPAFGYELAVIIYSGLERMYAKGENVYYYITTMNENYAYDAMPSGAKEGIVRGIYQLKTVGNTFSAQVKLLGSGAILLEVIAAAELLVEFKVGAQIFSVTSFTELARDATLKLRINRLHPEDKPQCSYLESCLQTTTAEIPVIAATDYVRAYSEQLRAFITTKYLTLGTDGFGRSDTRAKLRSHFEVDRYCIAYHALVALFEMGQLDRDVILLARDKFGINKEKGSPLFA